jgi:hypothetical protein
MKYESWESAHFRRRVTHIRVVRIPFDRSTLILFYFHYLLVSSRLRRQVRGFGGVRAGYATCVAGVLRGWRPSHVKLTHTRSVNYRKTVLCCHLATNRVIYYLVQSGSVNGLKNSGGKFAYFFINKPETEFWNEKLVLMDILWYLMVYKSLTKFKFMHCHFSLGLMKT